MDFGNAFWSKQWKISEKNYLPKNMKQCVILKSYNKLSNIITFWNGGSGTLHNSLTTSTTGKKHEELLRDLTAY